MCNTVYKTAGQRPDPALTLANIFYAGTQYIPVLNSPMGGVRSALAESRPTLHPVDKWSDLWISMGLSGGLAVPSALI